MIVVGYNAAVAVKNTAVFQFRPHVEVVHVLKVVEGGKVIARDKNNPLTCIFRQRMGVGGIYNAKEGGRGCLHCCCHH